MRRTNKYRSPNYDQNHGVPGVVYVLDNPGLREGLHKIGCSRRSGTARANDLNSDASTGTPGTFVCVFECRTVDCGLAEQRVFKLLSNVRKGKWGQEYFEVTLEDAKRIITKVCAEVDEEFERLRIKKESEVLVDEVPEEIPTVVLENHAPKSVHIVKENSSILKNKFLIAVVVLAASVWYLQSNKPTKNNYVVSRQATSNVEIKKETPAEINLGAKNTNQIKIPSQPEKIVVPNSSTQIKPNNEITSSGRSEISELSNEERRSLESVCSNAKYNQGPAAYKACLSKHMALLRNSPASPNLSSLGSEERRSIESVCSNAKYNQGPAAYNACLSKHIALLRNSSASPNLSSLGGEERRSIESVCSNAKYIQGPAAYNACLSKHLNSLGSSPPRPDLSRLSSEEARSIESVCSNAKYNQGPVAYNACLSKHFASVGGSSLRPDLSRLSREETRSIESVCSHAKYNQGPAAYNACLKRHLDSLK